jgi:TetR/AcrR family transcriptional repressor of nem operon
MGRKRTFIEADVVARCAAAFRATGYEGTSIDDLVAATGLHRGSLYSAFGSKRGLFLVALRACDGADASPDTADLLLVALMELAPRDPGIREVVLGILDDPTSPHTPETLGRRLLERAQGDPAPSTDRAEAP